MTSPQQELVLDAPKEKLYRGWTEREMAAHQAGMGRHIEQAVAAGLMVTKGGRSDR